MVYETHQWYHHSPRDHPPPTFSRQCLVHWPMFHPRKQQVSVTFCFFHSSKILMPLHNYTGLLILISRIINMLILETKLTEQLPESNSLTIKQTFLFNHTKQELQHKVLLFSIKVMNSAPYTFHIKVIDGDLLPLHFISLCR